MKGNAGDRVWTMEDIEKLRDLAPHLSARKIAGKFPGVSRNAVIGKLKRLGIKLGAARQAKEPQIQRSAIYREERNVPRNLYQRNSSKKCAPLPFEPEISKNPIPFETRPPRACGWIVGDPHAMMCCGREAGQGRYYCNDHHVRAWVKPRVHVKGADAQ